MFNRLMTTAAIALLVLGASIARTAVGQSDMQPPVAATSASAATAASIVGAARIPVQGSAVTPAMSAHDVQTFFDSVVPYAIHRGDIAGGVIVVVKDGQMLFAQDYGYADVATRKPVIADQTLFRPGSISKTFTWTSVMQLVDEGKIDLDKNVSAYLDFEIPEKFGSLAALYALWAICAYGFANFNYTY